MVARLFVDLACPRPILQFTALSFNYFFFTRFLFIPDMSILEEPLVYAEVNW